jgi:hypothetical protein
LNKVLLNDLCGRDHGLLDHSHGRIDLALNNWSADDLLSDHRSRLLVNNCGALAFLMHELPVGFMDHRLVHLVDNLLVALVYDRLMNLSHLLLVDNRLMVLVDDRLMMFMYDILVVLMNNIFVMLVNDIPVRFLDNRSIGLSDHPRGHCVRFNYSGLGVSGQNACLFVANDSGGEILVLDYWSTDDLLSLHITNILSLHRDRLGLNHIGHRYLMCMMSVS